MRGPAPLDKLARCLARLPGVGRRSAERMALALVRDPKSRVEELMQALDETQKSVCLCSRCGGVTAKDEDPCKLCTSPTRDDSVLCVVEEPADIMAIEQSGSFQGRYHALMGRLSPVKGAGPDELRIQALVDRLDGEAIQEIILAVGTDMEGDATANYLSDILKPRGLRVTRLATGMPSGSGIAYSDSTTLTRALQGRWSTD
jgi:recombination protein RecR